MTQLSYSKLANQLTSRATRAVLGLQGLRNQALRNYLATALDHEPGVEGSFLADPVFEAIFGWRQANQTMGDLAGELLHPDLVNALANAHRQGLAEDYRFPRDRHPYAHQLRSWQLLREIDRVLSLLITSGTGSGKTECFLVAILDDLIRELECRQGRPLIGVRALFLYPLNALIKSQQDRLVAWSEPFQGKVRFCLYNGDTRQEARTIWRCQVPDRKTLRSEPPPILVTNATMLEYLLVRSEDRPILDQSQGHLRWIVIDEAHSYLGSQAAELALLLRRVVHAFGVQAENVRFIATSATLGDSSETSRQHLTEFLADVAGVPTDQVCVIEGSRQVPSLGMPGQNQPQPSGALCDLPPVELFNALAASPAARALRSAVVERPRRLSELNDLVRKFYEDSSPQETLQLLDLCSAAVDEHEDPFLPLRGHFFHRTLSGIWACANSGCTGREGSHLATGNWPFGAVFLERRLKCPHCGFPVFDIVQCGECGAEYLSATEKLDQGREWLIPRDVERDEDEFQQELEPVEVEGDEAAGVALPGHAAAHSRLLTSARDKDGKPAILTQDGGLLWDEGPGPHIYLRFPDHDGCGVCHERDRANRPLFRPLRVGAPFLLGTAIPTLFEYLPDYPNEVIPQPQIPRPLRGRRLITFTDNRQGTARFAVKLQQEAERGYVRSLLFHSVAASRTLPNQEKIADQRATVSALEVAASNNGALVALLRQERDKLHQMENPPARLTWTAAKEKLQQDNDFNNFLLPALQELTYGQLPEDQIACLCLLREFFVRPRRQFSLEGLGIVQLRYPAIANSTPPPVMQAHGVTPDDWRALLRITIDFYLRSGSPAVAALPNVIRWLGYPGNASWQLSPNTDITQRSQRLWPSAFSPHRRRNRQIRLLARAFRLDLDSQDDLYQLDELLRAIWDGLEPVLTPSQEGYRLELENNAVLEEVRVAWLCPVTRRLLPTVFRGLTPYLSDYSAPDELALAKPLPLPSLPHPFWTGQATGAADDWLNTDPAIKTLRDLGAWTDISDRIARYSPLFLAKEHSAQLSGGELTRRENAFKEGRVNLLSCSTTMEMGVDIGGLTAVAMNNVPPHPANFLQRAGRAGRRGETRALSFTLCKSTPQGEAVFRDPTWPFTTRLSLPRVALQSEPIVQRHLNALALARFLCTHFDQVLGLQIGWFFEAQEGAPSPADQFATWCETAASEDVWLQAGVAAITRRTLLAGLGVSRLIMRTAVAIRRVEAKWRNELEALLVQADAYDAPSGGGVAVQAIGLQINKLRQSYLLRELAGFAFLPGYGFPTDVVPLVTTTLEDLHAPVPAGALPPDGNPSWQAGYPSRNLAIAIRDYAPGTDTVLDGRVYRSAGVTLNWLIPVAANGPPEIQSLRWAWRCNTCGDAGTRATMPETCPNCVAGGEQLVRARYLQPSGFAVDLWSKPHNKVSTLQYIPVREPLISLDGAIWMNLPVPHLGRYRTSPEGHLFQHSAGLHGKGYALCLRCGRADSQHAHDELPASLRDHHRLRGPGLCPGNQQSWAIQRGLYLGVTTRTDLLELQLRDPLTGKPLLRAAAYTLGVALRRALCEKLGIEEAEVGTTALRSRDLGGQRTYSIYLYDTASGGAGYASQAPQLLPDLLRSAKEVLECPRGCDNACQACVITLDSQHQLDHLNRHAALAVLTPQFLDALALPLTLRAFGDQTHLEMEPLPLALSREWQCLPARELRVHLGGEPNLWEPLAWNFRHDLVRFSESGVIIQLLVPQATLAALQDSQRSELAVLAGFSGANVYETDEGAMAGGLPLCIELGATDQAIRWAASDAAALAPASTWGTGSQGASYVRAAGVGLGAMPAGLRHLTADELRPTPVGLVEISISGELNGPAEEFGVGAWHLLRDGAPACAPLLDAANPLASVCYTDRYLHSPLVLHLLRSLFLGLTHYPGGIGANTTVTVRTARLERQNTLQPYRVNHDWCDAEDRRRVASTLMHGQPGRFSWEEEQERWELPHARELDLRWANGQRILLRLDQGLGYWRAIGGNTNFPFSADPNRQSEALHQLALQIVATSEVFPTLWYVSQ